MPIISTDAIEKLDPAQTLQNANGASLAADAYGQATTALALGASSEVIYGHLGFSGVFAAAPTTGGSLDVYLQPTDVSGLGVGTPPSDNFPHMYAGSIPVNAGGTSTIAGVDIALQNSGGAQNYNVWLRNSATGQTLNTGWSLVYTPKTIGPKP